MVAAIPCLGRDVESNPLSLTLFACSRFKGSILSPRSSIPVIDTTVVSSIISDLRVSIFYRIKLTITRPVTHCPFRYVPGCCKPCSIRIQYRNHPCALRVSCEAPEQGFTAAAVAGLYRKRTCIPGYPSGLFWLTSRDDLPASSSCLDLHLRGLPDGWKWRVTATA